MDKESQDFLVSKLNDDKYLGISRYVVSSFNNAKSKRKTLEEKWLKNRRQYDGIDDNPNFRKEVRDGRSKTYEKDSTLKADQMRARLFELFNPTADKNFSLTISNNPQLPKNKVSNIIYNLQSQYGDNLPKSIIEKAIKEVAEESALKLENLMEDYLEQSNSSEITQTIILDACIFGTGIVEGPLLKERSNVKYDQDQFGNWEVKTITEEVPYFEYVPIWEWFPDLDAKSKDDVDFSILWKVKTKNDLLQLCDNKSYIKENIKQFIKDNPDGNFQYEWYENQLISLSNESMQGNPKKYRVTEYWGNVDTDLVKDILNLGDNYDKPIVSVNVVMLGNTVIKCIKNPFDSGKIPVHFFNLYTKGGQLTGGSLMDLLEEKQKQLNAVVRAKFDNTAQLSNTMIEFNTDLMMPQDIPDRLNPGRIIFRRGNGDEANYPAIRAIQMPNNVHELLAVEMQIKRDMDTISSLAGIMTGDMNDVGKTLGRTSSGVSALMGGANTNLRDITKQYDNFNKGILTLLKEIIYLISDDDEIKGDFQIVPKITVAIAEKQQNSNNLSFVLGQLQPEQRQLVNWKQVTKNLFLYNNLDPNFVMLSSDEIEQAEKQRQLQEQNMSEMQNQMQGMQQQIEAQKLQNETLKAQGKNAVDLAKAQAIINNIENDKNKGDLNTMLALHKIEQDRENTDINKGKLVHDVISKEIDRGNTPNE